MCYFPEPYNQNKNKVDVELLIVYYATKFNLKSAAGIDALKFAKKMLI